jgi:hypothetical protein
MSSHREDGGICLELVARLVIVRFRNTNFHIALQSKWFSKPGREENLGVGGELNRGRKRAKWAVNESWGQEK